MSIFTQVKNRKVGSNTFDLSHDKKMSLKMGQLVPIHCQEIIPGDTINMSTSQMLRMAPMITPIMHKINVYTHFFFVPNRILWPNWEKFITGGEDGLDTTVFPYVPTGGYQYEVGGLADYLGLPVEMMTAELDNVQISALPFYAYNKIFNEYYRDQNLIDKSMIPDTAVDGDNDTLIKDTVRGECYMRAWQHDYFTSALPWTQKGPEARSF
jgi:hypothetical protein